MPDESTYVILVEGLAHEVFLEEAIELIRKLCCKGVLNKSLIEEVIRLT